MDRSDLEHLKSQFDTFSVLEQRTGQNVHPGKHVHCFLHPDNSPSLFINRDGSFHCYQCGIHGSDVLDLLGFIKFGKDYDRKSHMFAEVIDSISELGIKPMSLQERQTRQNANQPVTKQTFDPEKIQTWNDNLLLHDGLLEWLHKRGVNLKMILAHKLGYSENRLMIPHFYRGVCIAVKHRANPLNPTGIKYLSLKGSSFAAPYNADCLHTPQDKIYIVETELDALAIMAMKDVPTIALPAGGITPRLSSLLLFAKEIILIRDNDEAGLEMARKLKMCTSRAKVITTPLEFIKDVGAYVQEFRSLWEF